MARQDQVYNKRELEKEFGFAQAIKTGNTLYISGCVSWDADGNVIGEGDMRAQVVQVYTDIKETLAAHGATFEHVVKENVFTTDMEALEANNNERLKFFEGVAAPASTWIGCACLADPGLLVEIECIAVLD